jgi:hypothetical protein
MFRSADGVTRRDFLKAGALGVMGLSAADLLRVPSAHGAERAAARSVILLWMDGGPPQHETFDPKPGAPLEIRGAFQAIPTNVDGVQVCELMPRMARQMDRVALIRTLGHTERTHEGACHTLLTGRPPLPSGVSPSLGSVVAKELGRRGPLPPYVSIPGSRFACGYGRSGCLEATFNPFSVGSDPNNRGIDELYTRADDVVRSAQASQAFDLTREPDRVRDAYGRTTFGRGCLLARRLVEAGVRFVTVSQGGWDTHSENFETCRQHLVPPVDQAVAALLQDLHDRGLLASTLVVWMGEFGRTPQVNLLAGRDHWPHAGCAVLAGAGVRGGQVIGATDDEGGYPVERPVSPADVARTIYYKLGIHPSREYITPQDGPIKLLDKGEVIKELV